MKGPGNILHIALVLIGACSGMICAPDAAQAQCPYTSTVIFNGVAAAEGKPFQAKEVTTIATYGADGTKHTQVAKSNLFRDSKGRIRVERFFDGTEDPVEIVQSQILIYDNCGTSMSLIPARHTGKIFREHSLVKASDRPFCEEFDLNDPPKASPQGKFEILGHKMIEGVEVQGSRTSYYRSVEAKLSGAPPVQINESWCSKTLETPMWSFVLSEGPKREVTTVISDLKQIESDPTLFVIPEGYTVTKVDQSAQALGTKDRRSSTSGPR